MSLETWLQSRKLRAQATSSNEIGGLLEKIDRDIAAAKIKGQPSEWRLTMAHTAAMTCGTVALRALGYRIASGEGHHWLAIESLKYTIAADDDLVATLQACRNRRNAVQYGGGIIISEVEAGDAVVACEEVRNLVREWLKANHPRLLEP